MDIPIAKANKILSVKHTGQKIKLAWSSIMKYFNEKFSSFLCFKNRYVVEQHKIKIETIIIMIGLIFVVMFMIIGKIYKLKIINKVLYSDNFLSKRK